MDGWMWYGPVGLGQFRKHSQVAAVNHDIDHDIDHTINTNTYHVDVTMLISYEWPNHLNTRKKGGNQQVRIDYQDISHGRQ
jgi:hypothetical protein